MRAILSTAPGGPETLTLETVADPAPGRGEALVAVKAVGVNFPDTLIIEDRYQFRPPRPFSPGGELAGVVEALGEDARGVAVGDRVIAVPGWGGMVEKLAIDAGRLMKIPDGMDFPTAAALTMTYGTSYYALKDRARLKAGETLLVLGAAGGVGIAAVELGKAMGARVVAGVSSETKAAFAREAGADDCVIYPRGPLDRDQQKALSADLKRVLGGEGADVVYDAVGGDYCEPALRAMNWDGRYLVVGFPAGIPAPPLNLTLLKSTSIVGVFWGAAVMRDPAGHAANMADLFRLWGEGRIRPRISATWPLAQAGEAIRALGERNALGKVVVTVD
ncbi:MAG: NADPH:quinone oxidoreductase family protein [Brevundimonas sp.]|uniref:NADPH:quinone oxidoreductase family protein n=1 Tax=Brevundimonas sp. TaxID=1871086 RepID=UPI001851B2D5|nr:NADPH:quinone oxidoreductase family protein [Brevundimonas sp.]MBA4803681.1 NADPH:quinone oxidoreductase family protein [Brevundimonas sp.]